MICPKEVNDGRLYISCIFSSLNFVVSIQKRLPESTQVPIEAIILNTFSAPSNYTVMKPVRMLNVRNSWFHVYASTRSIGAGPKTNKTADDPRHATPSIESTTRVECRANDHGGGYNRESHTSHSRLAPLNLLASCSLSDLGDSGLDEKNRFPGGAIGRESSAELSQGRLGGRSPLS